jgi:alpha-2-macroglobulin
MRPVRNALAALAGVVGLLVLGSAAWSNPDDPALGVLRTTPGELAEPDAVVSVTFDRPVAGGLDEMVDAAAVFRIEPAVEGRLEWRDPVTLRFTPAAPLPPGARYTVTIADNFSAMDGRRLARPYRFSFRVEQARVLMGHPAGPHGEAQFLPPEPRLTLLLSNAVDERLLAEHARLELSQACGVPGPVRLRVVEQRRISDEDPGWFRYHGARGNDADRDLRRVVELLPEQPLPRSCRGALVVPQKMDSVAGTQWRWSFATYGPLRLVSAGCRRGDACHNGPVELVFSTPVRGADVLRHVRLSPSLDFTVRDTAAISDRWTLEGRLTPRTRYAVAVDGALSDAFEQRLGRDTAVAFSTPGVPPSVIYPHGRMIVERVGFRTIAVQHVNVDTLEIAVAAVPDSLEARFLSRGWGGWNEAWRQIEGSAERRAVAVRNEQDRSSISGIRLPVPDARAPRPGTLLAVQIGNPKVRHDGSMRPIALLQVTDLAVHAKIGVDEGVVWVTGVSDGRPRPNVDVRLHDAEGRVRARAQTDAEGIALLRGFRPPPRQPQDDDCDEWCGDWSFEGYVAARLGSDRALVGINAYDPDLSPFQFGVRGAWGEHRTPAAGAVFTERGIYRPGEPVYAKAIVRHGPLGALAAPAPGDSVRWRFHGREGEPLRDTVVALSRFGTADHTLRLAADAPLGHYNLQIQAKREGRWRMIGWTSYQVAEYRPPEFLVEVAADDAPRFAGDTVRATVGGRYLFGAPMAHAPVRWSARRSVLPSWELRIPGTDGYRLGESGGWWDSGETETDVVASGVDTLDARGYRDLRVALAAAAGGRPARVTIDASVVDANRQAVTGSRSVVVHPADFYIGAKPEGSGYFWTAGTPVRIGVITVRPDGGGVRGVEVSGSVVRREWHRVRRQRGGQIEEIGEWVTDTIATCRVVTRDEPVGCGFTPQKGGAYTVSLTATDGQGRAASTSFTRWTVGRDWVPWNDAGRFKIDVITDRERYSVGDTATVLIASPFTDVEAWVTVERERVLEQRRIRIASGTTTLRLPITEAHAPNAFVSVVLVRGRSARPGEIDDAGRPTMRVGYAELRVTPEVKRLAVEVRPLQPEYRPGDSARVQVRVRDAAGRGQESEVTLWAVDEGVLSLTAYQTPDPLDLLYRPRGLGMRLASNLTAVAPQVPEGQKGSRNPGGGGGQDLTGVLRSRFRPTAFFLGSVVTDRNGEATASAQLPDNVTTFRVMAVAVTAGDRFGHGESPLLATRPLIARPALPRFLREGDDLMAGVVVNHRFGQDLDAHVRAEASGVELRGRAEQRVALRAGRGVESRFQFRAPHGDTATFRFHVMGGGEQDAVELRLPVRPANRPVVHAVSGVLRDSASVEFELPPGIDLARSRLELGFGTSPLALVQSYHRQLELYPYACTEQIASQLLPLITLYRAQQESGVRFLRGDPRARIENAVRTISRRQRADGGIGLWSGSDWTSPWLTAYAGRVLLEARAAGVAVDGAVLDGLADYLARSLREPETLREALGSRHHIIAANLSERLSAADLLSQLGRPQIAAENQLLAQAARMHWEDRVLLAELLARRGQNAPATQLLAGAWDGVRVLGVRAVLPEAAFQRDFYFASHVRPAARLLTATLAIEPQHPKLGALVETLVQQGRAETRYGWTTQDYGAAVLALLRFEQTQRDATERSVRLRHGSRVLVETQARRGARQESTLPLTGMLSARARGPQTLRLSLDASAGSTAPVYYHVALTEIAARPTFTPLDRGIVVERWYETLDTRRPVTSVEAGQVVRVRLRITVPEERQMVILDDPLPAGLEAVDLSLRTVTPFSADPFGARDEEDQPDGYGWFYGSWDSGMWSVFDHKEIRDDRVVYFARVLWKGSYTATYLARATTAGRFTSAPAHAEEMYNPAVHGRSGGGVFTVR